jgi:hypothetical protein
MRDSLPVGFSEFIRISLWVRSTRRFLFTIIYLAQLEQLWLAQLPQPPEELLVVLPLASWELKAKTETAFLNSP